MADLDKSQKELAKTMEKLNSEMNKFSSKASILEAEANKLREMGKHDIKNQEEYFKTSKELKDRAVKLNKQYYDEYAKNNVKREDLWKREEELENKKIENREKTFKKFKEESKKKFKIADNIEGLNTKHQAKLVQYFRDSGFNIKQFDASNKDQRNALANLIKFKKEEIEAEKKHNKIRQDFWYEEYGFLNRVGALTGKTWNSAKTWFKEETGILGKGVMFAAGLFGGRHGGKKEAQTKEAEKISEPLQLVDTLNNDFDELNEVIATSFSDFGERNREVTEKQTNDLIKYMQKKKEKRAKNIKKIKDRNEEESLSKRLKQDGAMRKSDPQAEMLGQTKEQNKTLKKIFNKKEGGSMFGMIAGLLGALLAAGGIFGLFKTGKFEYIGSIVKGLVKGGMGIVKTVSMMLKAPLKLVEMITGKAGMFGKILKPFKMVDKMIGKILNPIASLGMKIAKFGSKIGKVGGVLGKVGGKAIGKVGKLFSKGMLKRIPGIGFLLSILFAIPRFKKGDIIGGLLELASGAAGFLDLIVPGMGLAIGLAIDLFSLGRDLKRDGLIGGKQPEAPKSNPQNAKKFAGIIKHPMKAMMFGSDTIPTMESGATNTTQANVLGQNDEAPVVSSKSYPTPRGNKQLETPTVKFHSESVVALAKEMQKGYGVELGKNSQNAPLDRYSGGLTGG